VQLVSPLPFLDFELQRAGPYSKQVPTNR
jgi:hypothetical protein